MGWAMAHAFSGEEACSSIQQLKTAPIREAGSELPEEEIDRLRSEFEKLPIDDQLSKR